MLCHNSSRPVATHLDIYTNIGPTEAYSSKGNLAFSHKPLKPS